MRVALTGASGFTGRFVQTALKRVGATPVIIDADLRDRLAVGRAVARARFDRVIHLAGYAFIDVADWQSFYTVNQIGTLNLLDAISELNPGIRCIVASSAQVYGLVAEELITEEAPVNPSNHYAISKYGMEQGAELWRDKLEIVITRPFNYTGIGQGTQYLVPKIVDHFRRRAAVIELGNTWVKRDFGDVRSVADAYAGLVMAAKVPSLVNICTGTVSSIGNIIEELTKVTGHNIDVSVNQAFVRAAEVDVIGGNATRLCSTLPSWKPRTIADTLRWMYEASQSI